MGGRLNFFQGFYEWMEDNILVVLEESRIWCKVLGAINFTFLALIPNEDNPTSFDDFIDQSLYAIQLYLKLIQEDLKQCSPMLFLWSSLEI